MTETPRTLTTEDIDKLLIGLQSDHHTARQKTKCIRNYCMAVLMLDAGLRVGEVVQLCIASLYFLNEPVNQLVVSDVIAKNHKERTIPLSNRIRQAVECMQVNVWSETGRIGNDYAFTSHHRFGLLTTRQVERIIRVAAMKSLGRPVHPHILRHTFASRLMRTTNARIVQELLGHTHLSTTQIYTHPNQDDLKRAIGTLEDKTSKMNENLENLAGLPDAANRPDAVNTDRDMG